MSSVEHLFGKQCISCGRTVAHEMGDIGGRNVCASAPLAGYTPKGCVQARRGFVRAYKTPKSKQKYLGDGYSFEKPDGRYVSAQELTDEEIAAAIAAATKGAPRDRGTSGTTKSA